MFTTDTPFVLERVTQYCQEPELILNEEQVDSNVETACFST